MDIINQIIENINQEFKDILTFQGYSSSANKSNHLLLIYQFIGDIFKFPDNLSDINLFLFRLNGNKYNIYLINDLENQKLSVTIYITVNME